MTINGIAELSPVTLTVHIDGAKLEFETNVIQGYKEPYKRNAFCMGVEPLKKDGKIVSFGNHPVSIVAKNSDDHREYEFRIAFHGLNKERTQLMLFSYEDISPVNHRNAYRVSCSYHTVIQIGNNKKAVDGYLRDISLSGIGMVFMSDEFREVKPGQAISAAIFDNNEHVYKVAGHIVRVLDDFADNKIMIGVQFDSTPTAIAALVTNLQRMELRLRKEGKIK